MGVGQMSRVNGAPRRAAAVRVQLGFLGEIQHGEAAVAGAQTAVGGDRRLAHEPARGDTSVPDELERQPSPTSDRCT